jgi:hypothetical protein
MDCGGAVAESKSRLTAAAEVAGIVGAAVALAAFLFTIIGHGQKNSSQPAVAISSQNSPSATPLPTLSPSPNPSQNLNTMTAEPTYSHPSSQADVPVSPQASASSHANNAPFGYNPPFGYSPLRWSAVIGLLFGFSFLLIIPGLIFLMKWVRAPGFLRAIIYIGTSIAILYCYKAFGGARILSGIAQFGISLFWLVCVIFGFVIRLAFELR